MMLHKRDSDVRGRLCSCIACSSSVLLPILETEGKRAAAFSTSAEGNTYQDADVKAFKRGQEFFRHNYFSMFVAHLIGLVSLLRNESILRVLILTGESSTPQKSFDRYFATIRHLRNWYESDIWNHNDSRGASSLRKVRYKHLRAQRSSKAILSHRISQTDMVLTQWAFVAPVVLQFRKLGFQMVSGATIQDFVYFWRIIGALVGIEDRFNICQGSFEDVQRECEAVLHRYVQPSIESPPKHSDCMAETMIEGVATLVPMLEPESFLAYTSYILGTTAIGPIPKWQYSWNVWILEEGFHKPGLGTMLRITFNWLMWLAVCMKELSLVLNQNKFLIAIQLKSMWNITIHTLTSLLIIDLWFQRKTRKMSESKS